MANEKRVPLHEVVQGILDDFEAVEGGPKLTDDKLRGRAQEILASPAKAVIGEQLIALAMRFAESGGMTAVDQLAVLATVALGRDKAAANFEAAGMASAEARELVNQSKHVTRNLSDALGLPKAAAGVGLRKKR